MMLSICVTPMTLEGVSDPTRLSADGQKLHYRRRSGPGTRSKNPELYDREGKRRSGQ